MREYKGALHYEPHYQLPTPEPNTLLMLGTYLFGVGFDQSDLQPGFGEQPPLSSHASMLLTRTSCDVAGAFTVTVSGVAGPGA
jgi:hypothetical protein